MSRLGALSPNLAGSILLIVSGACYAGMAALIKVLSLQGLHANELVFFRAVFGLVVVLPFFFRQGPAAMRLRRPAVFAGRAVIQVVAQVAFYIGIALIPLAAALTLSMSIAVFSAAGAVLFLGEPSLWRRWVAVLTGFAGAVVIISPDPAFFMSLVGLGGEANGGEGLRVLGAVLLVVSTMGYAALVINAKILTRSEPIPYIIVWSLVFNVPIAGAAAAFVWIWPTPEQWVLLFFLGTLGTAGNATMTRAFKIGEMTALTPVMYVRLLWAAGLGFVLFDEIPTLATGIGAALIVAAGIWLSRQEARGVTKHQEARGVTKRQESRGAP